MAFTRRYLTLLAGLTLFACIAGVLGAQDAPRPATFRLFSLGSVEPMYYRLDQRNERRVSLSTSAYSRPHRLPDDGVLAFYRHGVSSDPLKPAPRIPVATLNAGQAVPGRSLLIILVPGGAPGLPAPLLPDGTRAEFAAMILDDSAQAHPANSLRVLNLSSHPGAVKLAEGGAAQLSPLENKVIPYPSGDRAMLQVAAFTNNMWAPVASTLQMLAPDTRLTIFLCDTPPSPDNPSPSSVEYRKVPEVIRGAR